MVLTYALYVPDRFYVLPESPRKMMRSVALHEGFMRKNVPVVGLLLLVSACDVSIVQLMPWRQSKFYKESMGYPSLDLMLVCMVGKTMQSFVSVVCQLAYLWINSNLDDPTMSNQARALFGMSISLSMITLVMGLMILMLKWALLKKVSEEEAKEREAGRMSALNMTDLYRGNDEEEGAGDGIRRVANPLHSAAMNQLRDENAQLRDQNARLEERLRREGITVSTTKMAKIAKRWSRG